MKCAQHNKENIKEAARILKSGGVIAHPADTCYGLAADFLNPESLKKIKAIKGREADKPMSIMFPIAMRDDLIKYAEISDFAYYVCEKLLPGPVTILLPKGPEVPDYYFPDSPYIGLRIPYDMQTQDLLSAFKGPLITTSANESGKPPCARCEEIIEVFQNKENKPDFAFDGEVSNACLPSTVILVEDKNIKILREGPMTKNQLEKILGIKIN
ncbi:threonylcarbamoyl-AMP synthase [Candidatus Peregrinibacteria bacterium]|nr:threonylcarbamoyl-AMP synthase [Candidatus Peregrinibacteria bacterium]